MTDKQRVLVTGGFGYVGSRLTPHLLQLGHAVTVLDRMLYTRAGLDALRADPSFGTWENRFTFVEGDIRESDDVQRALRDVDAVIHLAAISNDPTGEVDETLTRQVNFDGVGVLLGLAREAGVRRFINASSSSVFGIKDVPDVTERLEPEPLTHYSKYKMLSEWMVTAAAAPDFCTVNIRPATICGYSPRQRFDLTVNKLTADAIAKGVITVHGGEQRRPNVGMTDMINLYALLLAVDPALINGRTFNFGFENHTVMRIAEIVRDTLADRRVEITVTPTSDHRDYHISSAKIQAVLGYVPVSSISTEVANLRKALEAGVFSDIEAPQYYNMRSMSLARNHATYAYLSR